MPLTPARKHEPDSFLVIRYKRGPRYRYLMDTDALGGWCGACHGGDLDLVMGRSDVDSLLGLRMLTDIFCKVMELGRDFAPQPFPHESCVSCLGTSVTSRRQFCFEILQFLAGHDPWFLVPINVDIISAVSLVCVEPWTDPRSFPKDELQSFRALFTGYLASFVKSGIPIAPIAPSAPIGAGVAWSSDGPVMEFNLSKANHAFLSPLVYYSDEAQQDNPGGGIRASNPSRSRETAELEEESHSVITNPE